MGFEPAADVASRIPMNDLRTFWIAAPLTLKTLVLLQVGTASTCLALIARSLVVLNRRPLGSRTTEISSTLRYLRQNVRILDRATVGMMLVSALAATTSAVPLYDGCHNNSKLPGSDCLLYAGETTLRTLSFGLSICVAIHLGASIITWAAGRRESLSCRHRNKTD